ncbi:ASCH domain-containing protein [Candidatus Kaiserbacteria bacterium]|nr:ASCH domain-containing protein [Candidatus Kaiserbacteria bacterium]
MNGESVIAFVPIKPIYAEKIISGIKRYEFRRNSIRNNLGHIIIYASSPIKKIIGVAEVRGVAGLSPSAAWESGRHAAGISRRDYRQYFQGKKRAYVIQIKRVHPLNRWVCPSDIDDKFCVPQSFSYVDANFFQRVVEKGMEFTGETT